MHRPCGPRPAPRRGAGTATVAAGLSAVLALSGPAAAQDPLRLLALGDSRVEGAVGAHDTWRYPLWRALDARGCDVDFIGPLRSAPYPGQAGRRFDADHASAGGATTRDIARALPDILSTGPVPDIVILAIGGNDLLAGSRAAAVARRVATIVARIRSAAPEAAILIEQIVPGDASVMTPALRRSLARFNDALGAVAAETDRPGAQVLAVDMRPDWAPGAMLADPVHYNIAGARHVANRYLEVLTDDLGHC